MSQTEILIFKVDETGGRPGTIEFFRREEGGYAIRFDAYSERGSPSYTLTGARITDADMEDLIRFHQDHKAAGTIAVA